MGILNYGMEIMELRILMRRGWWMRCLEWILGWGGFLVGGVGGRGENGSGER